MTYIKNRDVLLSAGDVDLRRMALDIAEAGLACADPGSLVRNHLSIANDRLHAGEMTCDLSRGQRIFVIGAGKATFSIAKAIDEIIGERIHKGLITCKTGQQGALDHIELILADHPIPSEKSCLAANRTIELLKEVRPDDIIISCFTGGSSALFVSPIDGISLEDKAKSNEILLQCGANIYEINVVRKHLSLVKGGRLVRSLPAGVHLINLTISDVIGDHLGYITDPSVPDTSTFSDARATLNKYDLWDRLPKSVTNHLLDAPERHATVKADGLAHLDRIDILLAKSDAACKGAAKAAEHLGFMPLFLSSLFEGDSSALGRHFVAIAKQVIANGSPAPAPCAVIGGGETTVTINGRSGKGGPNQEFVVGAALDLDGVNRVVALGMDTDGTDGPTEFAGGMVDGQTAAISREAGIDLYRALRTHNVTPALQESGHILLTGDTGTNVNDLKLVLVV